MMNKRTLDLILFGCLSLFILGVPVSMILQHENILNTGQEFRFKTAPVDPFDAFRGKFVALSLEQRQVSNPGNLNLKPGQKVFAIIEVGLDGFAQFSKIDVKEPKGAAYLKAQVQYVSGNKLFLDLPIDRYYMEESKAPLTEDLYRRHSSVNKQDAYVLVAVSKGNPVVKKLYVAGKPIEEALLKEMKK